MRTKRYNAKTVVVILFSGTGEQEFYAEKGFENEPVRCRDCRDARKRNRDGGEARPQREMLKLYVLSVVKLLKYHSNHVMTVQFIVVSALARINNISGIFSPDYSGLL